MKLRGNPTHRLPNRSPARPLARALLCLLIGLVSPGCPGPPTPPRAVIVLSLDTLRADHLGTYGYERATSPEIDALAARSVVFENALAQASSTLPSHRSLFQSRMPSRAGPEHTALAEVLGRNGFRTAAFTGGGNVSSHFGFARGFERYDEAQMGLSRTLDEVELWLRRNGDQRFFLFVHTYDIHHPYDPPPPFDRTWHADYGGRIDGKATWKVLGQLRRLAEYADFQGGVELDAADRRKIVALYDGGILYADGLVGRLLDLLSELGIRDSTLFVLLSDHGEEFWEHGSVLHSHSLYREVLHVPLIFSLPGARHAGRRIDEVVRLMDVAPTVLELLGIDPPPSFQGVSLSGLIEGTTDRHPAAISEILDLKSWTEPPWKLVERGGRRETAQLYDLAADPGEQRDVSHDEPEIVQRLHDALALSALTRTNAFVRESQTEGLPPALRERLEALGYLDE